MMLTVFRAAIASHRGCGQEALFQARPSGWPIGWPIMIMSASPRIGGGAWRTLICQQSTSTACAASGQSVGNSSASASSSQSSAINVRHGVHVSGPAGVSCVTSSCASQDTSSTGTRSRARSAEPSSGTSIPHNPSLAIRLFFSAGSLCIVTMALSLGLDQPTAEGSQSVTDGGMSLACQCDDRDSESYAAPPFEWRQHDMALAQAAMELEALSQNQRCCPAPAQD